MSDGAATSGRRPKTLILDVYGRYAPQLHGWLAVADLVQLMALLGVDEQAVRSAVSRMSRRGLLRKDMRDGVRGYATTSAANELLADGDRRIFSSMEPAALDDGWVLVSFSVPETERDKRHALRAKLMWLGMGLASSGLWVAPRRTTPLVIESIGALGFEDHVDIFTAQYEGFGRPEDLVRRAWDLDALSDMYIQFLETHGRVERQLERRRSGLDDAEAFTRYTLALHDWRKFPYLDPGLPVEFLPARWPGRRAADLFARLRAALEAPAMTFVARIVAHDDLTEP